MVDPEFEIAALKLEVARMRPVVRVVEMILKSDEVTDVHTELLAAVYSVYKEGWTVL
jgi:hypothetical protein